MNMKKLFIIQLVFLVSALTTPLLAQSVSIRGKVTDASDGLGITSATIVELDKNNRIIKGVISDFEGNYFIQVRSPEHKLQFSFIGYKTVVEEINGRTTINVALDFETTEIEEVQITAEARTDIGMNISDRELAMPIAKVDLQDVGDVQATSVDEVLQGRVSGIDIVANSGAPGSGMSIRVRGVSTLNAGDQPLIVIDNIPQKQSVPNDFDFATANDEGYADMLNISVEDIEEITVLKDAAATALWGPEGSSGVLMVKTKRGSLGRKPTINFNYKGSIAFKPDPIPMLSGDQYSTLIYEAKMNVDDMPLNTDTYKEFSYNPTEAYYYWNYSNNTNWPEEITRTGFTNNYDLSMSGGGSKASYRFSTNLMNQTGTTVGTDLKTIRTRLNLDYKISDKLMLRANFSYSRGDNNKSYRSNILNEAYSMMPNMAVYEYDVDGKISPNYFSPLSNIQGVYPSMYNLVAMANNAIYNIVNNDVNTSLSLNYRIAKGLTFNSDIAFRLNSTENNRFLPQNAIGLTWTSSLVNNASNYDTDDYNVYSKNRLVYTLNINDTHKFNASLQYSTSDSRGFSYYVASNGSASDYLNDPSIAARYKELGGLSSSTWQLRDVSLSALLHYSFKDRYIITFVGTRNGNSKFYEKYRYGYYPSVSASWRISSEPFMERFDFIEDFRLRYSYGQNGKAPKDAYLFFNNYATYSWTYMGETGVYPTNVQLENMKWENFITNNYGLTLTMLDKKVDMTFDYYINRTEDLIDNSFELPSTSGYSAILMNIGTLETQGWDFNIRSEVYKTADSHLSLFFNFSQNYNILREINENYNLERDRTTSNGEYKMLVQIGNPIGSFYGYQFEGVYTNTEDLYAVDEEGNYIQDPNGNFIKMVYNYPDINYEFQLGDAKYKDVNHDGNINYLDVVYLGNANPKFITGLGASYKYKRFYANMTFYGRFGNSIINVTQMYGENMYSYDNQLASTMRRWRREGDSTDMPRALLSSGYNWLGSDRYVHDGSFLRLKYISISYDLPNSFCERLNVRKIKVSATLNNILTFSNYIGQDPEVSIKSSDIFTVGYDYSRTPVSKQLTFYVNFTF